LTQCREWLCRCGGHATAGKRQLHLQLLLVACFTFCGFVGAVRASELIIGREALQTLVVRSLFSDQGRWYLLNGVCYAYLERPRIALAAARVIIDAHLSSRLGVTVGDACVGADMASNVKMSGKLVGSGSHIKIDDIRIDNIQDDSTRSVVELLQSANGGSLLHTVDLDLLPFLQPTNVPGTGVQVSATNLAITSVATLANSVDVTFDIKLTAR
jgi:hypothetical protein